MPKDIEIEIVLDGGKKIQAQLKGLDKTTRGLGDGFSKTQSRIVTMASAMQLAAGAMRILSAGFQALTGVVSEAIQEATQFEILDNKFRQVFRGLGDESQKAAERLQKDFGLSLIESRKFSSSLGDLLVPLGLTRQKSLELSESLVGLAVDAAAFSGTSPEEALTAFQSGLTGITLPLKKYGVVLSEQNVKQKAYELGIAEVGEKLTEQQKVVARAEVIQDGLNDSVGAYSRLAGTAAQEQLKYTSNVQDFLTILGQSVNPIFGKILLQVNELIVSTTDWMKVNQQLIQQGFFAFIQAGIPTLHALAQLLLASLTLIKRIEVGYKIIAGFFVAFGEAIASILGDIIKGWLLLGDAIVKGVGSGITKAEILFNKFLQNMLRSVSDSDLLKYLLPDETFNSIKRKLNDVENDIKILRKEDAKPLNIGELEGTSRKISDTIDDIVISTRDVRDNFYDSAANTGKTVDNLVKVREKLFEIQDQAESGLLNLRAELKVDSSGNEFNESNEEQQKLEELAQQRQEDAQEAKRLATEVQEHRKNALEEYLVFSGEKERQSIDEIYQLRLDGIQLALEKQQITESEAQDLRYQTELEKMLEHQELKEELAEEEYQRNLERESQFTQDIVAAFGVRKTTAETYFNTLRGAGVTALLQVESAASKTFQSMIKGEFDAKKAFKDLADSLLKTVVDSLVRLGAQYLIMSFFQKQTTKETALSEISAQAGKSYASQFANVMAYVPFPANVLVAPVAASLASASTIAGATPFVYAQHGLDFVDRASQPAMLHFGETVLTRDQSSSLVDYLENSSQGQSSGEGNTYNFHFENVQVIGEGDEAIGQLSVLMRRAIEEHNIFGVGSQ